MEKIRKISQITFYLLFIAFWGQSQPKEKKSSSIVMSSAIEDEACSCKNIIGKMVDESPLSILTERTVSDWLNSEFLPLYNELAAKNGVDPFPSGQVTLMKSDCAGYGAFAKKCKKGNKDVYFIMYDEDFINQINNNDGLNVFFVLCHELGHIISDNNHNVFPIDIDNNNFKKSIQKGYRPTINPRNPTKVMTITEKHKQEFTADTYAFWFLRKYIETFSNSKKGKKLSPQFTIHKLRNIFFNFNQLIPELCGHSETHPSCRRRNKFSQLLFEDENWKKVQNSGEKLKGFANENYASTLTDLEDDELNADLERMIQKEKADSLFGVGRKLFDNFQLEKSRKNYLDASSIYAEFYFPKDSIEVDSMLKEINKILSIRSFTHFSLLASGSYANYLLKSNGQNIDATHGYIGQVGLRLGRYSYVKPFSFEVDALYDFEGLQFDTYNSDRKALERFKAIKIITIQPKITYRFVGFKKNNATQGLVVSAGASWMNPLKFDYQNFQAPTQDLGLRMKPSWGATFGIGFENINRKPSLKIWGLSRVSIVSTYQPLVFESVVPLPQNYSAAAWTVGLSASMGVFPKFLIRRK